MRRGERSRPPGSAASQRTASPADRLSICASAPHSLLKIRLPFVLMAWARRIASPFSTFQRHDLCPGRDVIGRHSPQRIEKTTGKREPRESQPAKILVQCLASFVYVSSQPKERIMNKSSAPLFTSLLIAAGI